MKKQVRSIQVAVRFTPAELRDVKAACKPLGMKFATFVRTIVLREIAATFPDSPGAQDRLMETVAEMAGQVVREMSRGARS